MAGQRLTRVDPTYPDDARANGIEGAVVLHVIVGRDGLVESADPLSGPPGLREAAADAVRQWTYKPFLLNGDPVEVDTTVTVNFNLTHN
jgi:protein TonB